MAIHSGNTSKGIACVFQESVAVFMEEVFEPIKKLSLPPELWDVPEELRSLPNWVRWDENKVPLQADGITRAKINNPSTWSKFDDVKEFDRIGFVFQKLDGLVGIDLDGAISSDGEIAKWALEITNLFPECYTEESPSGLGIHIIARGSLPDGWKGKKHKLNETKTSHKEPGIEVYDNGRYFTFTGQGSGIVASVGDRLVPLLRQYWLEQFCRPVIQRQYSLPISTGHDVADRARKWLANKPGTQCGTASCHDHTFHAAQALINGFLLPDDVSFSLLSEWCDKGTHRWTETELNHKVNQVHANPCDKERGWLLVDRRDQFTNHVELRGLTNPDVTPLAADTADEADSIVSPNDPGPLSHDFFQSPGLIREMVAYHIATAPRPRPELSLAATLALLGTLTGRKIKSFTGMRTNLYIIGLADSGSGKEKPRGNNVLALAAAGLPKKYLGSNKPASDSAMINALAGKPSMLIQIDEVSKFFLNIKEAGGQATHLKAISDTMLELYGSSDNPCWSPKNFADSEKDATIANPHLCIYGTSTGEGFWRSVKSSDATDGFLARFMVIEAPEKHPRLVLKPERPIPQTVIDIIKDWDAFWAGDGNLDVDAIAIPFDSAAIDRLNQHNEDIEDRLSNDPRAKRPLWARTSALAQKLAMLFAASRGPHGMQVTLQDMQYAIRLANWSTRLLDCRIFTSVSENDNEAKKKRVLQIIRDAHEITWREMSRRTQWLQVGQRERNDIVSDLIEAGYVELVPQEGRAKPKLRSLAG